VKTVDAARRFQVDNRRLPPIHLVSVVFDWRITEAFLRTTLPNTLAIAEAAGELRRTLTVRVFIRAWNASFALRRNC